MRWCPKNCAVCTGVTPNHLNNSVTWHPEIYHLKYFLSNCWSPWFCRPQKKGHNRKIVKIKINVVDLILIILWPLGLFMLIIVISDDGLFCLWLKTGDSLFGQMLDVPWKHSNIGVLKWVVGACKDKCYQAIMGIELEYMLWEPCEGREHILHTNTACKIRVRQGHTTSLTNTSII